MVYGSVSSLGVFTSGAPPTAFTDGQATLTVETVSPGTSPVTITVKDTSSSLSQTANYMFATGSVSNVTVALAASVNDYKTEPGQNVNVQAQLVDAQTIRCAALPVGAASSARPGSRPCGRWARSRGAGDHG